MERIFTARLILSSAVVALFLQSFTGCTNYSSKEQVVNPPVVLAIAAEDSGHIITMGAQNLELGFSGYRLYKGPTEDIARDEATGALNLLQCTGVIADRPVQYIIEVKPDQTEITPVEGENRLCIITAQLNPGEWIALRSLIFKDLTSFGTSISSNAVMVP